MRFAGSGRGMSRARAAFWRNRRPKSAVSGSSSRINSSASSPVRPSKRSSGGSSRSRQAEEEAVVDVQAGGGHAEPSADPAQQGDLQPEVQLAAERREHGQAELAGLVQERLDQDRAIVGDGPAEPLLAAEELREHPGGRRLEPALALEPREQLRVIQPAGDLAAERADGLAQLGRARGRLAVPERHHRRLALGPADQHAMRLDGRRSARSNCPA